MKTNNILGFIIILFIIYLLYKEVTEKFINSSDGCLKDVVRDVEYHFPFAQQLNFYTGSSSYTINKKSVYICVKDKDGNYYTKKQLTFVVLHELAHAMNDEIGHGDKFKEIFEELLRKGTSLGLIDSNSEPPDSYCKS